MELIQSETTLVIAGAWNAAILTPDWVLRHGLLRTEPDQRVQVSIPTGPNVFEAPRYSLDSLTYVVQPHALLLAPSSHTGYNLDILEEVAARTLGELRHTPVTGVGHNFEYREHNPTEDHLEAFSKSREDLADRMPQGWNPAAVALHASFKNSDETVYMNVQRRFDAGSITMKFNFHHPVSSNQQLITVLNGDGYARMRANLATANDLVESLYGGSK